MTAIGLGTLPFPFATLVENSPDVLPRAQSYVCSDSLVFSECVLSLPAYSPVFRLKELHSQAKAVFFMVTPIPVTFFKFFDKTVFC
jgi:hypothetical protein